MYELLNMDKEHSCVNKDSSVSKDVECFDFIKNYLNSQSDIEMITVIDIYDRVILFALVTHNSDYIIKHWPGRDSVLLFITRLCQEMPPPYLEINVFNKEDYKFHEQISQFENKKI